MSFSAKSLVVKLIIEILSYELNIRLSIASYADSTQRTLLFFFIIYLKTLDWLVDEIKNTNKNTIKRYRITCAYTPYRTQHIQPYPYRILI